MTSNNHNPNDELLQAQADANWETLESGDRLGQAIKAQAESDLPPANPGLREMLSERLSIEAQAAESPVTKVTKESKLPVGSSKANSFHWGRWALVLSACVVLGFVLFHVWISDSRMETPALENYAQLSMSDTQSEPVVNLNPPMIGMGGGSPQPNPSSSKFGRVNQIGGVEVNEIGEILPGRLDTDGPFDLKGQSGEQNSGEGQAGGQRESGGEKSESDQQGQSNQSGDAGKSIDFYYGEDQLAFDSEDRTRDIQWDTRYQIGGDGERGVDLDFGDSSDSAERGESGEIRFTDEEELARWESQKDRRKKHTEVYNQIYENRFLRTRGDLAVSTFSIDVDTAAYANMRRFLNSGQRPPRNSVRIEELINYFNYDYPQPEGDTPFSVNMEIAACPWHEGHQLLRVGLKGKEIHRDERPVSNLVFLLDVSGSMSSQDKLPLVKRSLRMMVDQLNENDRISIVTYAGNAGIVLEPTSGDQKKKIHAAIEQLGSGGSTHGSAGIEKAYDMAVNNFVDGGVNRVIWATDGDLNVGITDDETLINLVSERARAGVFLTTLGFGTGNLKDSKLEQIANNGNGMYAYIDGMQEARKVLVQQMSGSLVTIAKDVKLQIEFNPAEVVAYRLIGYENRMLKTEDFDNDAKDAGEIGAGHTVTAIYEIVPVGTEENTNRESATQLKYQTPSKKEQEVVADKSESETGLSESALSGELLTLALRYKLPESDTSTRIEFALKDSQGQFDEASAEFRFAASVAGFGMLLRESKFRGTVTPEMIEQIATDAMGTDENGYRAEFLDLVRRVK